MKGIIDSIIHGNKKEWIHIKDGDCYIATIGKVLIKIDRQGDHITIKGIDPRKLI